MRVQAESRQQYSPDNQTSARRCDRQDADAPDIRRLVVLAPSQGIDQMALARKVWALAAPCALKVLYLGVQRRADEDDTGLRLRLITLAAMTRDDRVEAEIHIEPGGNWVRAVRHVLQPGDVVICHEEQRVWLPGHGSQPLNQVIEGALAIPVFMITGVYVGGHSKLGRKVALIRRMLRLLYLTLPLFIVCAFLYVQVRIDLTMAGFIRTVLLTVIGITELGLIGVWAVLNR